MPKSFQRGCPLPKALKDEVGRNSSSRPRRGTCRTCEKLGQKTQYYRDKPCPFMKGAGKYGWRGYHKRSTCRSFIKEESKRGKASLFNIFPLSFEGEGDKGGEVETNLLHYFGFIP